MKPHYAELRMLAVALLLACTTGADAELGSGDSPEFSLDTRLVNPSIDDSAAFDLNLTRVSRAWADSAWFVVRARPAGDCDEDGDVDLTDFLCFRDCFHGPDHWPPKACDVVDFDLDGDVDVLDFHAFVQHFTGPAD